jgi:hypothetical protein
MRIFPWLTTLACASALTTQAQISVEVLLDQEQYLRDESLPVKVRVTNRAGQTLRFGKDDRWLTFAVESTEGAVVSKLADVPVTGEFLLESAQAATRQVDLTPSFDLSQVGRYFVTATVRIQEWNAEVSSKPKRFEVVRGTRLWEQDFGVPTAAGPPEVRKYVLQQANYHKQLKLYLRLTDLNEHRVFRVFPIGPLVSFSQPEAQIDKAANLHVLFQTGARSFLFLVINPEGGVGLRQTYEYTQTRPTLRANSEGHIYVGGGMRRLTPNDLPPSMTTDPATPVLSPESTARTNKPGAIVPKDDANRPAK